MKAGFLLSNKDSTSNPPSSSGNDEKLGPLRDLRSLRKQVKFLWSGPADSIQSKPASWGWNSVGSDSNSRAPGWTPKSTTTVTSIMNAAAAAAAAHSAEEKTGTAITTTASATATATATSITSNSNINISTTPTTITATTYHNPYKNVPLMPNKTIGVPKNALSSWYGKRHKGQTIKNEQFQTWNDGGVPHLLKWTCLFTCPITGEKFPSGRYGDEKTYMTEEELKASTTTITTVAGSSSGLNDKSNDKNQNTNKPNDDLNNNNNDDDNTSMDTSTTISTDLSTSADKAVAPSNTTIWYNKKILAEHAAAARALDCLSLREDKLMGGTGVKVVRLCLEEPYCSTDEIAMIQIGSMKEKMLQIQQLQQQGFDTTYLQESIHDSINQNYKKRRNYENRNNYRNQRRGGRGNYNNRYAAGSSYFEDYYTSQYYNKENSSQQQQAQAQAQAYDLTSSYGTAAVNSTTSTTAIVPAATSTSTQQQSQPPPPPPPRSNPVVSSNVGVGSSVAHYNPYLQAQQQQQQQQQQSQVPPPPPPPPSQYQTQRVPAPYPYPTNNTNYSNTPYAQQNNSYY